MHGNGYYLKIFYDFPVNEKFTAVFQAHNVTFNVTERGSFKKRFSVCY